MTPEVGMGAVETFVTDTAAHVIVRVTPRFVWTRRVHTGPSETIQMNGPWPVTVEPGLLDQPYGDEIKWYRRDNAIYGGEYATRGKWGRIFFGHSYRRVDYSQ